MAETQTPTYRITAWQCACHAAHWWYGLPGDADWVARDKYGYVLLDPIDGWTPWRFATLADLEAAHGDLTPVEVDRVAPVLAELARLRATVERVRVLHWEHRASPTLVECSHCHVEWPCSTIAALDSTETTPEDNHG